MAKTKYTLANDVKIINRHAVYQGYFQVDSYELQFRRFDGSFSEHLKREVFQRGQAVSLLPYDPVLDKLVLIEEFRVGALEDKESPWLTEIVAGMIEPGETAEQVAMREAQEEAGLVIKELIPVIKYWVSPGASTENVKFFCGIVDASKAGGIFGVPEEHEDIQAVVVDRAAAYKALQDGRINNALTIIAIQWLELNYQELRKKFVL